MTRQLIAKVQIAIQKSTDFDEIISLLNDSMIEMERLREELDRKEELLDDLMSGNIEMP
jgi:hypothetical protein